MAILNAEWKSWVRMIGWTMSVGWWVFDGAACTALSNHATHSSPTSNVSLDTNLNSSTSQLSSIFFSRKIRKWSEYWIVISHATGTLRGEEEIKASFTLAQHLSGEQMRRHDRRSELTSWRASGALKPLRCTEKLEVLQTSEVTSTCSRISFPVFV